MGCRNLTYQLNFRLISQLSVKTRVISQLTVKIMTSSQLSVKTPCKSSYRFPYKIWDQSSKLGWCLNKFLPYLSFSLVLLYPEEKPFADALILQPRSLDPRWSTTREAKERESWNRGRWVWWKICHHDVIRSAIIWAGKKIALETDCRFYLLWPTQQLLRVPC